MIEFEYDLNTWIVTCDICKYRKCMISHELAKYRIDVRPILHDRGWKSEYYTGEECDVCIHEQEKLMAERTYIYRGAVLDGFGNLLDTTWFGQTIANSQRKARSNLAYRYKKERGMPMHVRIDFPEKIKTEKEK